MSRPNDRTFDATVTLKVPITLVFEEEVLEERDGELVTTVAGVDGLPLDEYVTFTDQHRRVTMAVADDGAKRFIEDIEVEEVE